MVICPFIKCRSGHLVATCAHRRLGSELRIGIVHARWNSKIIDALLSGVKKALKDAGVKDDNVVVQTVPGSYELPFAVQRYQ
jgi:6,7-dimethyl-8-ribityllumazine synthase